MISGISATGYNREMISGLNGRKSLTQEIAGKIDFHNFVYIRKTTTNEI
jgi:hypothetical protein